MSATRLIKLSCATLAGSVLLCLTFGCQDQTAKAELEKIKAKVAIEAQNKALVKLVYEQIDKGNLDSVKALMADDYVLHYIGMPEPLGRNSTIQLIKNFYTAFPDYTHVIDKMIAKGDKVVSQLTFHATHKEEFEGIPATGIKVTYSGMHMITITDGKIQEEWAIEDNLGLMQQLGMELKPKEAEK